jgi:hypothetical protein
MKIFLSSLLSFLLVLLCFAYVIANDNDCARMCKDCQDAAYQALQAVRENEYDNEHDKPLTHDETSLNELKYRAERACGVKESKCSEDCDTYYHFNPQENRTYNLATGALALACVAFTVTTIGLWVACAGMCHQTWFHGLSDCFCCCFKARAG